jgi:hypothetical protein
LDSEYTLQRPRWVALLQVGRSSKKESLSHAVNVGRDRFRLAFRTLNQAVFELKKSIKKAESEQWFSSKSARGPAFTP